MPALPPEETRSTPVGSNAAGGAIVRKWMDLHDQVTQLARIADLGAEGAIFDPVPFAEQLERASERQRNLAWQAIEDIDAMLQPGLTALHTITARGQNASAPALALWRELHAAREGLLAILACNTPGETRDAAQAGSRNCIDCVLLMFHLGPMNGLRTRRGMAIESLSGEAMTASEVARGVMRLFARNDIWCLTEVALKNGRRADLMGVDAKGLVVIVEVKVARSDLLGDSKWPDYLEFCDRFYWAVPPGLDRAPLQTEAYLPDKCGVIVADGYDAEILRAAPLDALPAARRKVQVQQLARLAMRRHTALLDPQCTMPDSCE